ncbi:Ent-kaurene synthase [Aspergillus sclerotioniger CBS 115572]|uniref:Ent-kaurene synthase n=1 Tax=Aspergillus sclerotioniger CBS 115572 TaxID=1450535 RepID=A0A317XEG9_9EURO|nr:Ent-kaurene synthase [Aspergillus sclerotioniger CBS 115572]PWY96735.1 Ent-kaurene synthase [Aspergillus sclerotioniger CBS 115572]
MTIASFRDQLQQSCDALLQRLANSCTHPYGMSSISCSIYDTAWVSMIAKTTDDSHQWLFPSSFNHLLETQTPEGGWESNSESDIDQILNTMAALLSLVKHRSNPTYGVIAEKHTHDPDECIARATDFLRTKLQVLNVAATDRVGLELLIPAHQRYLANEGIVFDFPGQKYLSRLNSAKLRRFSPELLYGGVATTLTHSLEAFIGLIDFDRLRHRLDFGSMLASPSSTSAYLIHAAHWDDDAEAYVRAAVELGTGKGSGAVPSAFPTTIFELAWVASTLLEHNVVLSETGQQCLGKITRYLKDLFNSQNGVVGFAPTLMADADDTAKTLLTLNLSGYHLLPDRLIEHFRDDDHFRTYPDERDPSISANCNVLCALLRTPDPGAYASEIEMTLMFLYKQHNRGTLRDKWNTSQIYPRMLLANALVNVLRLWEEGPLRNLPKDCIQMAPILLCEILHRTLQQQNSENGSWHNGSPEVTAYALLTLVSASNSPLSRYVGEKLRTGIIYGRAFLEANFHRWAEGETIWIEKVSYKSSLLSSSYCIAAIQAPIFTTEFQQAYTEVVDISIEAIHRFSGFYSRLPLFANEPRWNLTMALVEARLWFPLLVSQRHIIFPRHNMSADNYLEYIPQTWTACNARNGNPLETDLMWEMMMLSMLNYQVDEFLESVIGGCTKDELNNVRVVIHQLCNEKATHSVVPKESFPTTLDALKQGHQHFNLAYIDGILRQFTAYILTHPAVLHSSPRTRVSLTRELKTFLLAHLADLETAQRFRSQSTYSSLRATPFLDPPTSYFSWVRSTSADHTSCPYSFQFLGCLITYYHHRDKSGSCPGAFQGPRQRYLAEGVCRHLATMCRQYNDYGSILRDVEEGTLNSVDFPEFWEDATRPAGQASEDRSEHAVKEDLMWLAEYERECCFQGLMKLVNETGLDERTAKIVKTFVDVTDLYGQIYVARDIASRVR